MSCKRSNTTNCGNIVWNAIYAACPQSGRFVEVIAEDDLRELLENRASEPTLLTVKAENIRRLRELMNNSEVDD